MSFYSEFRKLGIDTPFRNNGNIKVVCPECQNRKGGGFREKSLELNFDNGYYKCHKSKCGWGDKFVKKDTVEYSRPEWKNKTDIPFQAVKFFEGRGISQDTIKKARITVDERGNIQFNYFRHGQLVNIKTRLEIDGKKSFLQHKGAEKILFGFDTLAGKEKAIIVEGEMDALSWMEAGVLNEYAVLSVDQGAPAPGQKAGGKLDCLTNCAEELDKVKEFFICTDKDGPGMALQDELIRRLGEHRCNIVPLPDSAKDANDVLCNTLQDIQVRREALVLCLRQSEPAPVPGIQMLDGDIWDEMVSDYHNGDQKGTTTHFPEVDRHFTFYPKDITLVTGIPGDGKGQFIRQLQVNKSKFDGWKWACYVPEDMDAKFYFRDLCEIYSGKPAGKEFSFRMDESEYSEAMEFVREHFFIVEPIPDKETGIIPLPTNEWLNERIRFLKLKYGVNAYVKDPWNKIYHNISKFGREDQYLAQELSKEKFFAKGFDAAFYVAHPTKMRKDMDGRYPCPTPYDISGGAMFYNMFDNCLTVFRPNKFDNPSDKTVEFHSFKIKKQKLVGQLGSTELIYDRFKNRYYQLSDNFNPFEQDAEPPADIAKPVVAPVVNSYGFSYDEPRTDWSAQRSDGNDEIPF